MANGYLQTPSGFIDKMRELLGEPVKTDEDVASKASVLERMFAEKTRRDMENDLEAIRQRFTGKYAECAKNP